MPPKATQPADPSVRLPSVHEETPTSANTSGTSSMGPMAPPFVPRATPDSDVFTAPPLARGMPASASMAQLQEAIRASQHELEFRIQRNEQGLADMRASVASSRTYNGPPYATTAVPFTPFSLRPGVTAGVPSRPGYTPGIHHTPTARGVSGFAVQLTPAGPKTGDPQGTTGIGLTGVPLSPPERNRALDGDLTAGDRLQAARRIDDRNDPANVKLRSEMFVLYLDIVERENPGASDDELVRLTDQKVAEAWIDLRRNAITKAFETRGSGPTAATVRRDTTEDNSATKKEFQRRINLTAAAKLANKLTHQNYLDWMSDVIGFVAAIPGAIEILEGIEHGPDYHPDKPDETTPGYDYRLDVELGGFLANTVEPECKGYVVARQAQGDNRGSFLWRDLISIMRRTDGIGRSSLLEKVLHEKQTGTEDVRAYASRLRTLFIKSAAIGAPFSESDKVMYLLRGLQRYLDGAKATVRGFQSQGSAYTFEQALLFLVEQEATMAYDRNLPRNALPLLSRPAANVAQHGKTNKRFVLRNTAVKGQPGYFNGECRHRHKWGHKEEDCAVKKREIDSGGDSRHANARVAAAPDGDDDEDTNPHDQTGSVEEGEFFELEDEDGHVYHARLATTATGLDEAQAQIAQAMLGRAPDRFNRPPHQAMAAQVPKNAVKWILDSGATHHMTTGSEQLACSTSAPDGAKVHVANGDTVKITKHGAGVFEMYGDESSKLTAFFETVLVVPSFTNNLLSVTKLTEDGWSVSFSKTGVDITGPNGGKIKAYTEPKTKAPYIMMAHKPTNVTRSYKAPRPNAPAVAMIASDRIETINPAILDGPAVTDKEAALVETWHRRLGHLSDGSLSLLLKDKAFEPKDRPSPRAVLEHITEGHKCAACIEAKQPLLRFLDSANEPKEKMADIHFDLTGQYEGNKDYKYALHILDAWSRMLWTFPLPNKEAGTVFTVFEAWASLMQRQGHGSIKRLHCDHGREFENSLFQDWARKQGIAWNFAAPNTSQQNGLIERWNRTVQDRARAMLRGARLSDSFWPYAFRAATAIINKSPSTSIGNKIPLTRWTDEEIDYDGMRVFGCLCWVIKPSKNRRNKLSVRSIRGTYLGPAPEHKAHLVFTPAARPYLRVSRHVIFDEARTYDARFALDEKQDHTGSPSDIMEFDNPRRTTIKLSDVPFELDEAPADHPFVDSDDSLDTSDSTLDNAIVTEQDRGDTSDQWPGLDSMFDDDDEQEDLTTNEWSGSLQRLEVPGTMPPSVHGIQNSYMPPGGFGSPVSVTELDDIFDQPFDTGIEDFLPRESSPVPVKTVKPRLPPRAPKERVEGTRRSSRLQGQPAPDSSANLSISSLSLEETGDWPRALAAFNAAIRSSSDGIPIEPKSLSEAKSRPDWNKWEEGMKAEIDSLTSMSTWILTDLPPGRKPIGCRWTYKLKLDADGKATRWKARLVAQGFSQRAGVDYSETFAPVARLATIRIIVAIACYYCLKIWSMDVVTAFLNGTLLEEIYMMQPPHFDDGSGRVCRLYRSLYGLKQSGREWFAVVAKWLISQLFKALLSEPCVFVKYLSAGEVIVVVLYVDDVLIMARTQAAINTVRDAFTKRFKMTDNGPLTQVLGLKITMNPKTSVTTISQKAYIEGVAQRFGLDKANPVDTPMTAALQGIGPRTEDKATPQEISEYASMVGCIMWAAQGTRPDIAYATGRLGRFMANPRPEHIMGAKRVIRYLYATRSIGLVYTREHGAQITGYSDADHAKDTTTRRSVSGFAFFIHGNLVSWRSRLQATVAISSTESEYVAMSEAAREAKWMRSFTTELGYAPRRPTDLLTDSSGAYSLARNPEGHNRLKHVDTHHHFVRELVATEQVSVTQISTADNAADIFTKVLSLDQFHNGMHQLGLGDYKIAEA